MELEIKRLIQSTVVLAIALVGGTIGLLFLNGGFNALATASIQDRQAFALETIAYSFSCFCFALGYELMNWSWR